MKTKLTVLALALSLSATAQEVKRPIDLNGVGIHLEKAGKQRTTALVTTLVLGGLGGAMIAMDPDMAGPAGGMVLIGFSTGLVLNLSANGHEKKAGRILQRK